MSGNQLTREEVARIELGQTEIRPRLARILVAVFLASIVLPSCLQLTSEMSRPRTSGFRTAALATQTLAPLPNSQSSTLGMSQATALANLSSLLPSGQQLRAFEDRLNEASLISRTLGPWVGWVIKGIMRGGDEQAYFGREGWLFYRQSVDSVSGAGFLTPRWQQQRLRAADQSAAPQPNPLKALIHFQRQLNARGISLVVIPTPGKETVYPEKLAPRWHGLSAAVQNASFELFKAELVEAGVLVFDPSPLLVEMRRNSSKDVYLKTDTHWAPAAMERVSQKLASWMRDHDLVPVAAKVRYQTREQEVCGIGDIVTMLNLPNQQRFFPTEPVQTTRVLMPEGDACQPDESAPVLLMGDSFCNIYSLAEMGWGDSAGFAEHLGLALGQRVDRLVINAGGAFSTRQELVRQLASGRDRLAGKRVVVYQFAARELAFGDWRLLDLPSAPAAPPVRTSAGEELLVQGRVSAIARLPQPGSVPYRECLQAIHLTQVRSSSPGVTAINDELLVYALGMRDNRWLPVAAVPVGADIRCRLLDWAQVEKQYGTYNRAELDDLDLLSLPTFWAEEVVW